MLNKMNRQRIEDRNCMLRPLAFIVYGDEMLHNKIEFLADFISENHKEFCPYIKGNIVEYIARVRLTRVWGTAVELTTSASLFDMPVFTLTPVIIGCTITHWKVIPLFTLPRSLLQRVCSI